MIQQQIEINPGSDLPGICHAMREHLSEYLDDELARSTCAELEIHLQACPDCRVLAGTMRQMILLYRAAERTPMPPTARTRLIHFLQIDSMQEDKA
jgi:predicted anti-sigma-YlaC factor YlaD